MRLAHLVYAVTMTVGSLDTARMLFRHFGGDQDSYKRAPKGFRRIGAGCYRTVYLEKSTDTVYKIGSHWANTSEAFNARRLRRKSTKSLGFELIVPETRTYRMPAPPSRYGYSVRACVSAQQYAGKARGTYCASQDDWMEDVPDCDCKSKSPICWSIVHNRVREFSNLDDIHGENILMDRNGVFWLIDLGC